jgi:alpha/beta superfamily hydrolase
MHTKAVYQGTKGLVRIGCAVLRFNFRGVGRSEGTFDQGDGEKEDFRAALGYMASRYPGVPLWAAGFSFGAWIALETGAADPRVSVLIGIAPPVSKAGYDFSLTKESTKPKFFVQGEADDICPIQDMWKFYGELHEPKELVVIDAADHLFDGHTTEIGEALEDLLSDFTDVDTTASGQTPRTRLSSCPRSERRSARRLMAACARRDPMKWRHS